MLAGLTVLITGGTGSFGNALVRHLLATDCPRRIRVFSRDEFKQAEMRTRFADARLRFLLGDVRDRERLREALRGVDIVFHAAALKRIEACAYDPTEAIATNVLGSMNLAAAARACEVPRVVALSSDKACAPSTTYGATKLCMEQVFTSSSANAHADTRFSVIRYGNVAGSRGSVIPAWRDLVAKGEPVPVTDPQATRFWFTLKDAVDLALLAAERCTGGEVVVPHLSAFSLEDLAVAMRARVAEERMLPRPGEKKHEAMISVDEAPDFRKLGGIYVRSQDPTGEVLPPGFALSSDTTTRLSVAELRRRVG